MTHYSMNDILPYHEPSVIAAKEMTKDDKKLLDKYCTITRYVTKKIHYDYIRAITISKKNGLPDVQRTWEKKRGICLDIAALTTGMLRAVGINAHMHWGKADGRNHAWVEAIICGKRYRYDHDGKARMYKTDKVF